MFGLDELVAVVPPPEHPRVTMTTVDWHVVYEHIGIRLPTDFIQTYARYGDGYFYSKTHRMSAGITLYAGNDHRWSFSKLAPERLNALRLIKEKRPKCVPFPLYWEPKGLLPWGRLTNDTDLCWRVHGDLVDDWTVVVLRPGKGQHESFEMSAIQFLARAISGKISCSLLPKGLPGEKGVAFEACMGKNRNPEPQSEGKA